MKDGLEKSPSGALRCILRHCGVPKKYASFLRICAPCIWSFLRSHPLSRLFARLTITDVKDTSFKKVHLDNGIRVVAERIPSVKSVSLGMWVGVGSRDESEKEGGISHFIEHMFFKGTRRRSAHDIALEIDSIGGELN